MGPSERFSRWFVRQRHAFAIAIAAVTILLAAQIRHLEIFTQFADLLPRNHPYVQTYETYREAYGTANTVVGSVVPHAGDIYQPQVLEAVDALTQGMDSSAVAPEINARPASDFVSGEGDSPHTIHRLSSWIDKTFARESHRSALTGVDHNLTTSLTHRTTRAPRVLLDGTLVAPQLVEEMPRSAAEWDEIRKRVRRNPSVFGVLVSVDERAALVRASFIDSRIDYEALFKHLRHLESTIEAQFAVDVHITGQPMLFGWIFAFSTELLLIFGASVALAVLLLWVYFRRSFAVFLPLSGAVTNVIWGLGFAAWLGIPLDPLVLVIPMLITARAISHSVQFVERFYEEYEALGGDKEEACIRSMAELLLPGTLAILTDCLGLLTLSLATIPLIHNLGILCAFWSASIAATEMLLNRLLILYLPAPRQQIRRSPRWATAFLGACGTIVSSRTGAAACVACFALVASGSLPFAARVAIGESRPGTPILYPESEFNVAAKEIGDRFFGLDELLLIAHSDTVRRLYAPDALKFIDATQRVLETDPSAGGSLSMLDVFKETNRRFHNNDPRWAVNFQTTAEISGFLYVIENSVPAQGVLNRFRDYDGQSLSIRVFYRDHRASTIDRMEAVLREFSETERLEGSLAVRMRQPEHSGLRRWLGELLPPPQPSLEVTAAESNGERRQLRAHRGSELARGAIAYWEEEDTARKPATARGGLFGHRVVEGKLGRAAEVRQTGARGDYELWVRRHNDADWELRPNGVWLPEGVELRLAAGTMGVLAAANEEISKSHRAALIVVISVTFLIVAASYRSLAIGVLLTMSLAVAALAALAVQGLAGIGLNVNTLPVQAIGIGIGVDYGIYVVDRARKEMRRGLAREAAIKKAVETTGTAVVFTASTLLAGIVLWIPLSSLRFSADMSLLLSVLMALNAIGAVLLVPAILRLLPRSWISEGSTSSTQASSC